MADNKFLDIKTHVATGNTVTFQKCQEGNLIYKVDQTGLMFRVPVSEMGTAVAYANEKAMTFMKYISRELKMVKEAEDVLTESILNMKVLTIEDVKKESK